MLWAIRIGSSIRGAGSSCPADFFAARRRRARFGVNLREARRHSPRAGACRRAGPLDERGGKQRQARRLLPLAEGRQPVVAASPANPPGVGGLELRAAHVERADYDAALLHLRGGAGPWPKPSKVCCDGAVIETWEALDLLSSLVDKSLVNTDDAPEMSTTRYRLLGNSAPVFHRAPRRIRRERRRDRVAASAPFYGAGGAGEQRS